MGSTSSYSTWRTLLLRSLRTMTWAACRERRLELTAFFDAGGISRLRSLRRTDLDRIAYKMWIVHFPCSISMPKKICSAQKVSSSVVLLSIGCAGQLSPLLRSRGFGELRGQWIGLEGAKCPRSLSAPRIPWIDTSERGMARTKSVIRVNSVNCNSMGVIPVTRSLNW